MRLLSTETGHFVEINDRAKFEYAILSHTWDPEGEQSYREVRAIQESLNMPILQESAISDVLDLFARSPSPAALSYPSPSHVPSPALSSHIRSGTLSLCTCPREAQSMFARGIQSMLDHPDVSLKIKQACAMARSYGHRYIWIDSCCIDKDSSSELSEAINSMFRWYRDASVCYAFLADVPISDLETREERTEMRFLVSLRKSFSLFRRSRWFTRGWTLQELLAPRIVMFVSREWKFYGSKGTLADVISQVTDIDREVLTHREQLQDVSVFHRMSWASGRTTTRVEDQAYSLLGIFDIHMPILYGEGRRAFMRLQHAILHDIPDQSLLIWSTLGSGFVHQLPSTYGGSVASEVRQVEPQVTFQRECSKSAVGPHLFATTPSDFSLTSLGISALSHTEFAHRLNMRDVLPPKYSMTPYGVNTRFPVIPISQVISRSRLIGRLEDYHFALLACEDSSEPGSLIAMVCILSQSHAGRSLMTRSSLHACVTSSCGSTTMNSLVTYITLSKDQIERLDLRIAKVHIPTSAPALPDAPSAVCHGPRHTDCLLPRLSPWNLEILRESGIAVACVCDGYFGNLRLVQLLQKDRGWGIQLRFEVVEAFIPFVNVWVTPFHECSATAQELLPYASPGPAFRLQVLDIHQEQSVRVNSPQASGGEHVLLRLGLCYLTSSNSCSLTVEVLQDERKSDPRNDAYLPNSISTPATRVISAAKRARLPPGHVDERNGRSISGNAESTNIPIDLTRGWGSTCNEDESGRSQKRRRLFGDSSTI